jgi:DnaJ like chaperone protein
MVWTGKLVGAFLGYVLTRRPIGVLIGLIVGHIYDLRAAGSGAGPRASLAAVRATFFRAAFSIMGHVAKSDGRVSEQDIAAARRIFRQFSLGEADTRAAMELFTQGKQPGFDAEAMLAELVDACRGREAVLRMFLEIQMPPRSASGPASSRISRPSCASRRRPAPTAREARDPVRRRAGARRWAKLTKSSGSRPARAMPKSSARTAGR